MKLVSTGCKVFTRDEISERRKSMGKAAIQKSLETEPHPFDSVVKVWDGNMADEKNNRESKL